MTRARRARMGAGALCAAVLATSVATAPGASAELGGDPSEGAPEELIERLKALDDGQDVEAPPWQDSPSTPIAVPDAPEAGERQQPKFPEPRTFQQSLNEADVAGLEASAKRPIVVRSVGRRGSGGAAPAQQNDEATGPEPANEGGVPGSAPDGGTTGTTIQATTEAPGADDAAAAGGADDAGADTASAGKAEPSAGDTTAATGSDGAATAESTSDAARGGAVAGAPETLGDVEVTVLDRDVAERAGVTGFVFTVEAKGGSSLDEVARRGARVPVELEIDYSGFASANGAGFADRLRVVALPACAVEDPMPAGCNVHGRPLASRNRWAEDKLVVEVPDLAGLAVDGPAPLVVDSLVASGNGRTGELDVDAARAKLADQAQRAEAAIAAEISQGEPESSSVPGELAPFASTAGGPIPLGDASEEEAAVAADLGAEATAAADAGNAVVLAVTSGVGGDSGTFGASPLSPTGQWTVSTGSGEFSWSYPIDVPAPPGGTAPSVGLSYSSGAVDGLTHATNTQASQNGLGFGDFANAFIERSYEPCVNAGVITSSDLCWKGHAATISLGGIAGPLIPVDAPSESRQWRVQDDPGWRIERIGDPGGAPVAGQAAPEYWKVTGPDGTQYFFGRNHNPDSGAQTNSYWWVLVNADHVGEPCFGNLGEPDKWGACDMAWRWNLDRVVDPHGNVTTYTYTTEAERYDAWNGLAARRSYIRGGTLTQISYGAREGSSGTPAARVTFGRQLRCIYLVEQCDAEADNVKGNPGGFPDVPVDLICGSDAHCPATAPPFFSTRRYSHVLTEVRDSTAAGGWRAVAQHNLYHQFKGEQNTTDCQVAANHCKLYLAWIQHVGLARGLAGYPTTELGYTGGFLANRVDTQNGPAMRHYRVTSVQNPLGGLLGVTYGRTKVCMSSYSPARWDQNKQDCFPQSTVDNGFRRVGVFNKWSVTEVSDDPRHGSPALTTTYTYEGDPAWAFDWGAFSRNDDRWGWSSWRGYKTTKITQGTSTTRVRSFRGWHGDPVLAFCDGVNLTIGCLTRNEQVSTIDGSLSYDDDRILAGKTLEEASYGTVGGVANQVVESTRYTYEIRETADPVDPDRLPPRWAGVASSTERVATAPGQFRERGTRTAYNANRQPGSTEELGWLDVTGDERCSFTWYADNPAKGMFVYPFLNGVKAGLCAGSGATLSAQVTAYDGAATAGTPPTKGDVTKQSSLLDAAAGRWADTTTSYDILGRPLSATDPNGHAATTAYVPAASTSPQVPRQVTVTNALGHQSLADLMVEFGVPLKETDPNGNVTTYEYDEFGRTSRVRQPTEQPYVSGDEPSWKFSYQLSADHSAPPIVRSQRLTSSAKQGADVVLEDMWNIYDGHGRDRQTHTLSPTAGKVIVDATIYDNQGRVRDDIVPQAQNGPPGQGILNETAFANRTRYGYDELGRSVTETWMRGTTAVHTSTHAYGPDAVTVTGPEGNKVRETVDGLGRTVEAAEHDGSGWVATSYGYDLAGNLRSVTDPEGHVISYTYDTAGRRIGQSDPNRGAASFTYDAAGNRITATDAAGQVVHTSYDALDRPAERRKNGPTGPLLASWAYDAAGEKGLLDKSVRHDATGQWVTDVTGYDGRGRATGTKLTVPAGVPGLSGDYTVSQLYDRADRVVAQGFPAVGRLPAEILLTTYSQLGLPLTMGSFLGTTPLPTTEDYVRSTGYDDRGRPSVTVFGPVDTGGFLGVWMAKLFSYNADQQLSGVQVVNTDLAADWSTPAVRHNVTYNKAGLVTERTTESAGLGSWKECFGFDTRMRLTRARTVALSGTCEAGTPTGGAQPYDHSYSYSPGNRLVSRTEQGQTTTHTYPASGQPRPYAPVQVGGVTFEWDANGNLTERTSGGEAKTFTWDAEQRLESVEDTNGESSFVYDAGGQRLLRTGSDGTRTLYFAGHEVTASPDGSTVTAVRSYSYAGELIATRTPDGLEYLVTDERGSVEAAAPSGGAPSYDRAYQPYGAERAADGDDPATDRGWLGQVEDTSTGLSYLNARYYDTKTAVFTSPDPVYDPKSMKTLNPYTYGLGNPTSFSDASGLSPSYTFGLERQNWSLRQQNKQLIGYIQYLGGQIAHLQDIIRQQQNAINQLLTHIEALEAVIRQQAHIIDQLNARVRYLTQQVNYWRNQAYYWRGQAIYWRNQAMYWRGQAMYWKGQAIYWRGQAIYWKGKAEYYRGVIGQLVNHAFRPGFRAGVLADIDAGLGVTSWQGSAVYRLRQLNGELSADVDHWQGRAHDFAHVISELDDEADSLRSQVHILSAANSFLEKQLNSSEGFDWGGWALDGIPVFGTARWLADGIVEVHCQVAERTRQEAWFDC